MSDSVDRPRSRRRHGLLLLLNVAGNFVGRGLNLFTALLVVPLAVGGLGPGDYGVFAVILSAATFVTYADFGMGLAMVNPITASEARGDHAESRRVVGETWSLLIVIAAAVLVIGAVAVPVATAVAGGGASAAAPWIAFVVSVALGLPAALTQRLLFALQRNFEGSLWLSAGKLASLAGVYLAHRAGMGLTAYVVAVLGVPMVVGWINTGWLFLHSRRDLAPAFGVSVVGTRWLLPEGLRYLVLQIGPYVENGFDIVLVGLFLGTLQTTSYDLITRVFNYVPALAMVGIMPLWPAVGTALAHGDRIWVDRIDRLSEAVLLVVTGAGAVLLVVHHSTIVHLWTGHVETYGLEISLPLAFVVVSISHVGLKQSLLLAAEGPRWLSKMQMLFLGLLLPAKVAALVVFGLPGLAITTAVFYLPRHVWTARRMRMVGSRRA